MVLHRVIALQKKPNCNCATANVIVTLVLGKQASCPFQAINIVTWKYYSPDSRWSFILQTFFTWLSTLWTCSGKRILNEDFESEFCFGEFTSQPHLLHSLSLLLDNEALILHYPHPEHLMFNFMSQYYPSFTLIASLDIFLIVSNLSND